MSRITRAPVKPGDLIGAADLNSRFDDYDQAGQVGVANTRDAAFDLAHFDSDTVSQQVIVAPLGTVSIDFSTYQTVASFTGATYPTPSEIVDSGGTPTRMTTAFDLVSGQILRVYWNLSVRPNFTGTPWTTAGSLGDLDMAQPIGATAAAHCASAWLAWLEWDITSGALANWVPVNSQTDFQDNPTGSIYGGRLPETTATTCIPAWYQWAYDADYGKITVGNLRETPIGWRGVSGCYYFAPSGPVTIYGIRLVIAGIANAWQTSNLNYFVWDADSGGAGQTLDYTAGALTVVVHTTGA
jgi:hypothetical protein